MARKIAEWTVPTEGRDKGKVFRITEMDAEQAEAWALRVLFALFKANVELPDNWQSMGMAGIAQLGFKCLGGLDWETAQPLLAEMFDCIEIIPDPKNKTLVRVLVKEDIEEPWTRMQLRKEVWNLHVDFSHAGESSPSGSAAGSKRGSGRHTPMSRA